MSRKGSPNFKKIITYILKEQNRPTWTILHNLNITNQDTEKIIQAFHENYALKKQRKGGVAYYHEILSFSNLDKEVLIQNPWIMEDLAREYIHRRAETGIVLAHPHLSDAHPHVHLLIGNSCIITGKSVRISKSKFEKIKREIETIQQERYPEITHSTINRKHSREQHQSR